MGQALCSALRNALAVAFAVELHPWLGDHHAIAQHLLNQHLQHGGQGGLNVRMDASQHAWVALLKGRMVQHKNLGLLHTGRLRLAPGAVNLAAFAKAVAIRPRREVSRRLGAHTVLHGVEAGAQHRLGVGVALKVFAHFSQTLSRLRPGGCLVRLHQVLRPRHLRLVLRLAGRAMRKIAVRVVLQLGRWCNQIRLILPRVLTPAAAKINEGLLLLPVLCHPPIFGQRSGQLKGVECPQKKAHAVASTGLMIVSQAIKETRPKP